tara:strand:- start:72 stop:947 length:876 start_codon:yes stop_codon:yes gene_type:complete
MNIIFEKIKNKYLKIFIFKPKIISAILFIPFLYILGWVLAKPIFLIGVANQYISLIGTIITFLIFVISLPKWFELRWGLLNAWELVGVKKTYKKRKLSFYFLKGLLFSFTLMILILIPIVRNGSGYWLGNISADTFFNATILIIAIGFAEELIFRGWLFEELKNQFGLKNSIIFQALIFSLVHIGFDMPFWEMTCILTGLFLLGVLLALFRLKDNNSLWGCIGLHGGLVGGWFLINNGLVEISKDAPTWLVGPGSGNTNPLGGFVGIILLLSLCFFYLLKLRIDPIFKNNI